MADFEEGKLYIMDEEATVLEEKDIPRPEPTREESFLNFVSKAAFTRTAMPEQALIWSVSEYMLANQKNLTPSDIIATLKMAEIHPRISRENDGTTIFRTTSAFENALAKDKYKNLEAQEWYDCFILLSGGKNSLELSSCANRAIGRAISMVKIASKKKSENSRRRSRTNPDD